MDDFMGFAEEFFFPKPLVIEFFSLAYKAIVWQVFPCKIFFRSKSVFRIFYLKSPIPPLPPVKCQMVGPYKLFARDRPY